MYEVQADYVRENIDTESLRQKYHADNVIYFFLFNTPYEHTPNPWSLGFSSSTDYDIEYVNLYIRFGDMFDAPPSTYAHEIMPSVRRTSIMWTRASHRSLSITAVRRAAMTSCSP